MSEADVPQVCLACEPHRDPLQEIFSIFTCHAHTPDTSGELDRLVEQSGYLSGGSEVEGINNKLWCDAFHRNKWS